MARIFSGKVSASLKWLADLDREDLGIYGSVVFLVGALIFYGYEEILTRVLLLLFACQTIYKVYRRFRPKKPTGPIYKAGINQMKGVPKVNGKKGFK